MEKLKIGECMICHMPCPDSFTGYVHPKCANDWWEEQKWNKAKMEAEK